MDRALNGLPVEIWGDGSVVRDFLYVGDLAEIVARAARYSGEESVFNVGSGVGTSVNALVALLEDVLDIRITRRFLAPRTIDVHENVLNNDLAALELGWKPKVLLRDGLVRTAGWMKQACVHE